MSKSVKYTPEADFDRFITDVKGAVGKVKEPERLDGALKELCKLLLDPEMKMQSAPDSQVWRLLMGLNIAGNLSEDEMYTLARQFADISVNLYPIEDDA